MLDPAKVDSMLLDPEQIDPKKLDAKTPNAWIALGLLEMRGGNLAGGKASFEHAMAQGDQRHNQAAVAAAALALGQDAYRPHGLPGDRSEKCGRVRRPPL